MGFLKINCCSMPLRIQGRAIIIMAYYYLVLPSRKHPGQRQVRRNKPNKPQATIKMLACRGVNEAY